MDDRCKLMGIRCSAPDIMCPHWQGTFCDYDLEMIKKYGEAADNHAGGDIHDKQ